MSEPVDTQTTNDERPLEGVDELEQATKRVRDQARADLGVTGEAEAEPLRKVLREEGLSIYPLVALSVLGIMNILFLYAFAVLTPDIGRSLGLGVGAFAGISALDTLAITLSPLPMAWLTQRKARRALICIVTALLWSVLTIYMGFVVGLIGILVVVVLDGFSTGSAYALHRPLVEDGAHCGHHTRESRTDDGADDVQAKAQHSRSDGGDGEVAATSGSAFGNLVGGCGVHVTSGTTRVRRAACSSVPRCSGCA